MNFLSGQLTEVSVDVERNGGRQATFSIEARVGKHQSAYVWEMLSFAVLYPVLHE